MNSRQLLSYLRRLSELQGTIMDCKAVLLNVTAVLLLSAQAAQAGLPADLEARVRAIVEEERARFGTPAMSVAVMAEGRTPLVVAAGYADIEARIPATTETMFQAASVTKTLTAAIVMREVESGRLRLDAPVNDSLPPERRVRDTSGAPAAVTLRHLLSHSSGLPFSGAAIQEDPGERPRSLDEHLAHGLIAIRRPGEKLIYANDGFALAGWLTAQAGRTSYEALAQKALLDPLRMTRSTFVPPRQLGPELAVAYDSDGRIPHVTISAGSPAAALITTAADLARFGLLCLGRGKLDGVRLLKPESIDEMMRLQARSHPRIAEGFGLGFGVKDIPGHKVVLWGGQFSGASSYFVLLPDYDLGVAVLANHSNAEAARQVSKRILDLLAPSRPQPARPDLSAAELSALIGTYKVNDMLAARVSLMEWLANFTIEQHDGELRMTSILFPQPARLTPLGGGTFRVEGSMLDGATGIVDGDRLVVSFVEARRIPGWLSARALFIYAGTLALTILAALFWGMVRLIRRQRARLGRKSTHA
jgi:CubicO group peptidase (beta-lactamase class C family)